MKWSRGLFQGLDGGISQGDDQALKRFVYEDGKGGLGLGGNGKAEGTRGIGVWILHGGVDTNVGAVGIVHRKRYRIAVVVALGVDPAVPNARRFVLGVIDGVGYRGSGEGFFKPLQHVLVLQNGVGGDPAVFGDSYLCGRLKALFGFVGEKVF